MFRQAIEKLERELRTLEKEYRHDLPKEIKRALAMGDLRENAEYHAALERQSYVKAKIGHIKKRLSEIAMIKIDSLPRDRVGLGSTVVLYDLSEDKEVRYELVFADDSDFSRGLLSVTSPIGKGTRGPPGRGGSLHSGSQRREAVRDRFPADRAREEERFLHVPRRGGVAAHEPPGRGRVSRGDAEGRLQPISPPFEGRYCEDIHVSPAATKAPFPRCLSRPRS